MRKNILLLLALLSTLTSFAQSNAVTIPSRWSVGVSGAVAAYSGIKAYSSYEHTYTSTKVGFRGGMDLCYRFSERSALATGLHIFDVAYQTDYKWIFIDPGDPSILRNSDVRTEYLDVPAIYHLTLTTDGKLSWYAAAGFVASIRTSQTTTATYEDNSVREFDELHTSLLSMQLGVGLQYMPHPRIGIKIEPQYRIFLKGFDSIMAQSPMAGLGSVAVQYHFVRHAK